MNFEALESNPWIILVILAIILIASKWGNEK